MKSWPVAAVASAVCAGACTGRSKEPPPTTQPSVAILDAAVDGISTIGSYDPSGGAHLDDDVPAKATTKADKAKPSQPIDIMLRSTPPGARVIVDGAPTGTTPTLWTGDANGREHEYTFSLPGFATARYRFVPVTSGVVHARLDPVPSDEVQPDAGVAPESPAGPGVSSEQPVGKPQYPSRHTAAPDAAVPVDAPSMPVEPATPSPDAASSAAGPNP